MAKNKTGKSMTYTIEAIAPVTLGYFCLTINTFK